ncbi:MAG: thioredoxin [Pyrinomonadaceae bacterium]|nr:thioredoxin [Pyrinomonadaceae bacterium]
MITDGNFAAEIENSKIPVLLDFWATWCPPCKMIAPTIDALAKELAGKVKIGKLDVDKNPRTASKFRVQSIPTLIIFKNGEEVDRIVGAQSKAAMMQRLQAFM